jgi:hypothetical protein
MESVTLLPLAIHTLYAELVDRCQDAQFATDFPPQGSFRKRGVKGKAYWYYQEGARSPETGTQRQMYVGPETPEVLQRIAEHGRLKTAYKERRSLIAALKRARLTSPPQIFGDLVAAMAEAGVFRLRACLVGTFAFQAYEGLLGVRFPGAHIATLDLDIAQFREISLAVAPDDQSPPLLEVLRRVDPTFELADSAPTLDRGTKPTRYANDAGVRVDVLVPNRGPDPDGPEPLPALGTHGQLLRYLDYLIHEPVQAVVLHGAGVMVTVPRPERFAVHKLIVSQVRYEIAKKRKDVFQAQAVIAAMLERDRFALGDAFAEALARGPKWRKNVLGGLDALAGMDRTLRGQVDEVVKQSGARLED